MARLSVSKPRAFDASDALTWLMHDCATEWPWIYGSRGLASVSGLLG
jgi:hypothetical protein